jgi:hypothetical protein
MAIPVAAVTGSMLVTCEYDTTGLAWCIMHDNVVLAWMIDDTDDTAPPVPKIVGSMPGAPTDTSPVLSPVWAVREGGPTGIFFVPNMLRGTAHELFTFIASNNDAKRQIYTNFADQSLTLAWQQWASANPQLALAAAPQ